MARFAPSLAEVGSVAVRRSFWSRIVLVGSVSAISACSSQPSASVSTSPSASTAVGTLPFAGTTGALGAAGTQGLAAGSGGNNALATGVASHPAGDVPCAVASLLEQNCVMCHGHRPRLGAPISLTQAASFQKLGMSGLPLQQVVATRVQSQDRPMPPMGLLAPTVLSPLLTWLAAGAVADPAGCAVIDPADASGG